jgi:hypothetical protein
MNSARGSALEPTVAGLRAEVEGVVHSLVSEHPDWVPARVAAMAAGRFGIKRLARSAIFGAVTAVPIGGTIAGTLVAGTDEAQSLRQVIMMAMAVRLAYRPGEANVALAQWLANVLEASGLDRDDRSAVAALVGKATSRAAGTNAVRKAATTRLAKRLGKYAPFGAGALLAVAFSATDVVKVARAARRLADADPWRQAE